MERWRIFLKTALSLIILSSLFLGRTGYADPLRLYSGERVAARSNAVNFPPFADALLDGERVSAIAEFVFRSNAAFDLRSLQVALNGKLAQLGALSAKDYSRWERRQGTQVLLIEIGRMRFDGKRFADRVKEVQKLGGRSQVWLSGCERIRAAQIYFVKRNLVSSPPTLSWVGPTPLSHYSQSTVTFQFISSDPTATTQCRMDGSAFGSCKSPVEYRALKNGWHSFQARAVGPEGRQGPVLQHSFWVWVTPPAVQIVRTVPSESPTILDSFQAFFKLNWSFGPWTRTECSLDSASYSLCQSGIQYAKLGSGEHLFRVRIRASFWRFTWVSSPSEYAWTVSKEPLRFFWVKTPESETSGRTSSFEIGSNRPVDLECLLDGSVLARCESTLVLKDLSDGDHFLVVTARERGQVAGRLEHRWLIDTTAPEAKILSVLPSEAVTNQTTLALTYSLSEPGRTRCFFNGKELALCSSPILLSSVPEGRNELVIEPIDRLGNVGARVSYDWQVDLTSPELTLILVSPTHLPTNQRTANFSWEGDASFSCRLDDRLLGACQSPMLISNLSHGNHTFAVVAIDEAGNQSEEKSISWEVDLIAPNLSLVSTAPQEAITESDSFQLTFDSEPGTLTTCELDAGGPRPCVSPFVVSNLAQGVHSIVVASKDAAGNFSPEIRHEWRVAARVNVQLLSSSVKDLVNLKDARFEFGAVGALRFECALDGNGFSACQSPMELASLAEGNHRFALRAVNVAEVPGDIVEVVWKIDSIAPVVSIISADPSDFVTSRTSLALSFSANEAAIFSCSLDGAAAEPCTSAVVWTGLGDGNHTATITARDEAGNEGVANYAWRVLTAPLQVSAVAVQNLTRTSAVIRWSTNFPAEGRVSYGVGGPSGFETAPATEGTSASVTLTGLSADTVYQAQVLVTDKDGRTAVSSTISFSTLR
jgi:large repetitive protein